MQRPILEFFKDDLQNLVYVSSDYTSLLWENCVSDSGRFEIHIPVIAADIQPGMIVKCERGQREPYGIVSYVSLNEKDDSTVIMGNMLSHLLKFRYFDNDYDSHRLASSKGAGRIICTAASLDANLYMNMFFNKQMLTDYEDEDVNVEFEFGLFSSNFDIMKAIAENTDFGFYCTIDSGAFKAGAYKSRDNGVCFNTDFGEISDLVFTKSDDNLRNAFNYTVTTDGVGDYVRGNRDISGLDRREIYLGNFTHTPSRIITQKKKDFDTVKSISGTVHIPYIDRFNVGEIVTVEKKDWGLSEKLVISSVTEIWEEGYKCSVTFGKPQDTAYRKILKLVK